MEKQTEKIRFALVGAGWRAMYYVRIARALPDRFELTAMLCRSEEKARLIREKEGIHTVTSARDLLDTGPDFAVVAVTKASIAAVTMEWLGRGIPVLCETPAFRTPDQEEGLRALTAGGALLAVAEQYTRYPGISAVLKLLDLGLIGEPDYCLVSLAHEYHGASLIRAFLRETPRAGCRILKEEFLFPCTETFTRYEKFTDGRTAMKKRTLALCGFEDGKAALYEFDSGQYFSSIRKNLLKIQGSRGEIHDDRVFWLDEANEGREDRILKRTRRVRRNTDNPNFREVEEVLEIRFGDLVLYEPPFGLCGLTEDETAMARILAEMGDYVRGTGPNPCPLEEAAADVHMGWKM